VILVGTNSDSDSDSEKRYRRLLTDRGAQVRKLEARIAGFADLASRFKPVAEHVAAAPAGYDIINDYLRTPHAEPMVTTLKAMKVGDGSRSLDDLLFGTWASNEAMAETTQQPDGSGLVVVSDAIIGICIYLSSINALWLEPMQGKNTFSQLMKASRAVREGTSNRLSLIGGGLLRYHLLHLRIHGLPAQLTPVLGEKGMRTSEMMCLYAIRFLCAHEAAHYLLGHASDPVKVLSAEALPLIKDSHALEYEADEVAARAVALTCKREGWPDPPIATAGVVLAIAALSILENSTFARRARTHPAAATRWQRIQPMLDSANINNLLRGMRQAIAVGGNPSEPMAASAWDLIMSSPEVTRAGHDNDYLQAHAQLDTMLTSPTLTLVEMLSRMHPSGADLASGLEHARLRNIPEALRAWGVPARDAAELADEQHSLGFYSAVETLLDADSVKALPNPTERRFAAAALTTILTRENRWLTRTTR
jgi:hypothetical protein